MSLKCGIDSYPIVENCTRLALKMEIVLEGALYVFFHITPHKWDTLVGAISNTYIPRLHGAITILTITTN
jgi:hypothetical protein